MSGADDEKRPDPNFQRRPTHNPDKIPLYSQAQRALLDPHAAPNLEATVELPYHDEVTGELSAEQFQELYQRLLDQGAAVTVSAPLPDSFAPTNGPNPLSFDPLEVTSLHQDRVPRPTIPLWRGEVHDPLGLSQIPEPLPDSFADTGDAPPLSFDPRENETALTPSGPASRAARQRWRIQADDEPLSEEAAPSADAPLAQERHGSSASTQWTRPHLPESDPASYGSVDSEEDDHEVFAFDPRVAGAPPREPRAPEDPFQDAPTLNYEPLVKTISPPRAASPRPARSSDTSPPAP
jgi:hypothetical protein